MRTMVGLLLVASFAHADSSAPARDLPGNRKPTGVLRVEVGPPGATVLLDGKVLNPSPEHRVDAGLHRLTLKLPPRSADLTVRVSPSRTTVIKYRFDAAPDPGTEIKLMLNRDQALFLDGEAVERDEALALLKLAAARPDVRVTLYADQSLPHAKVVALMDLVREAGIAKIALAVSPAK
jgi:biopolymer transport protein ExbD